MSGRRRVLCVVGALFVAGAISLLVVLSSHKQELKGFHERMRADSDRLTKEGVVRVLGPPSSELSSDSSAEARTVTVSVWFEESPTLTESRRNILVLWSNEEHEIVNSWYGHCTVGATSIWQWRGVLKSRLGF